MKVLLGTQLSKWRQQHPNQPIPPAYKNGLVPKAWSELLKSKSTLKLARDAFAKAGWSSSSVFSDDPIALRTNAILASKSELFLKTVSDQLSAKRAIETANLATSSSTSSQPPSQKRMRVEYSIVPEGSLPSAVAPSDLCHFQCV